MIQAVEIGFVFAESSELSNQKCVHAVLILSADVHEYSSIIQMYRPSLESFAISTTPTRCEG